MSNQYTFEIENFNQGKNLTIDVDSVEFSQFSHLSATTAGTTTKAAEHLKEIVIYRKFDQKNSHLFTNQTGKSFPKAVLQVKSSGGGKSYLFTFLKAYLDSSYIYQKVSGENFEKFKFFFDEFSYSENSPVGTASKPKTSTKQYEAAMNYVKG